MKQKDKLNDLEIRVGRLEYKDAKGFEGNHPILAFLLILSFAVAIGSFIGVTLLQNRFDSNFDRITREHTAEKLLSNDGWVRSCYEWKTTEEKYEVKTSTNCSFVEIKKSCPHYPCEPSEFVEVCWEGRPQLIFYNETTCKTEHWVREIK